ncbi:MAG: Hydroxylamine oxidoreductase [Myxococcaceae bacterium]|nr:Hydroxylamine oxidoreductase [Myxococcaceae bacterium]
MVSGSRVSFGAVFVAVTIGTGLVVGALLLNAQRPVLERTQPSAAMALATGKCAECHRRETSAIVHEYEGSKHAAVGVNCLDCHRPVAGQAALEHRGFTIAQTPTAKNCQECHATEYEQFARSRHAAPAWASVNGPADFTPAQLALGERHHPGWVKRTPMTIGSLEGASAIASGCNSCHAIGKPNPDGSFGTCTQCHGRHSASVELAREPTTCGQCHMGPDHSQLEIYGESKHGALFVAQRATMNLKQAPKHLTTADMPVPTCATCHMSGLEGMNVTHDTTERLSWFLFAPLSTKRPDGDRGQTAMKEVCTKCHARSRIDRFYTSAEQVLSATNEKVQAASAVVAALRTEGLLTATPLDEPIEFREFDLWHYYGRTAKHGAFMGGADFVQWHGNYELLRQRVELDAAAAALRRAKAAQVEAH